MTMLQHLKDSGDRYTVIAWAIAVVGFLLRILSPSTIYFNIHAERDLWRALQILQGDRFPYLGSELTQGGYTLGPALYLLEIPPLLFTLDPRGLLVWIALLHGGALFLTYRIGREHFSPRVGLAAAALFATFPLAVLAPRYLWNPSFLFPLTTLAYWSLLPWILNRDPKRVPLLALSLALMFQVHLSALALIILTGLCALVYRPPLPRRVAAWAAGIVLACFLPYLIGEVSTGFQNTRWITNPPDTLVTANGAEIPIISKKRTMINEGAMMALQVALSPVLYDRRFETGSFSYLHLLGEFGPERLDAVSWRLVYLLHQLRWLYILLYGLAGILLFWMAWRNREPFGVGHPILGGRPRGFAIFVFMLGLLAIVPPIITATMHTYRGDELIGVGAIRYFFILFPVPFLCMALLARVAWRGAGDLLPMPARRLRLAIPILLVGVVFLQGFVSVSFFRTAKDMRRAFKYSLHESFDWSVQREAADILVNRWGVSPAQFNHRMDTLDHTFTTQRWDVISLEQGLDYAYYTHRDLDMDAPPRHPDSFFVLYDMRRTPVPDLGDRLVLDRAAAGELMLLRVDRGVEHEFSPIQNTWEKLDRPRRLRR
jgi:hypothetical protein